MTHIANVTSVLRSQGIVHTVVHDSIMVETSEWRRVEWVVKQVLKDEAMPILPMDPDLVVAEGL